MEDLINFTGISSEEAILLSSDVREKLLIAFDSLKNEVTCTNEQVSQLKSEYENTEKQYLEQLNDLKKRCDTHDEKSHGYTELLENADTKFRSAYSEKEKAQESLNESQSINNELTFAIQNLENEKELISEQLRVKLQATDELTEEINLLRSDLDGAKKLRLDAMVRSEEITGREASLSAQETRWNEQSASMQRHVDWLEERLRQTTDQLLTVRRDTTQKCYNLESELETRTMEMEHAKKSTEVLEESVRKLTQANEDYIRKLKQVADEQIRLEQLYGNELDAQKQLVNLYKEQVNEADSKNSELADATTSMQAMLKSAYETISRLETEKTTMKVQYNEEQIRLQELTQNMTNELDRTRQLLDKFRIEGFSEDELRQLNPAVAATLSALKRGHSLTQLYSDYIQVVEDRDQLRLDKHRLTEYVKQLVDDVKEKVPVLRDQQENYKRMKVQIKDLSAQLQSTSEKFEESDMRRQELQRRAGYFQREANRSKQTCADLSKQVQVLLREVEIARGTVIEEPMALADSSTVSENSPSKSMRDLQLPDSSSTIKSTDFGRLLDGIASSASDVISDHLVTWRGLQDLQSQNQRLLCVARDLSAQLEKHEQEESVTTKRINEFSTRLETLTGELDVVRLTAREARTEVQILTRQRDMYRVLLKRYDIPDTADHSLNTSIERDSDSVEQTIREDSHEKSSDKLERNTISSETAERLEETLASIETEFKRYREDKIESDKIYTTTIDELRKEGGEARLLNQKLAAQLDFTHEKLRTMEANVSGYKQEITVLREMNARYSTSAASSEAELARLREDLIRTSDKLLQVEVDARHSTQQLELSKANETRWRLETEALRRQEQMHTQLMHQLQAIQGNLEQRESTDRVSLGRRLKQLEDQLAESQAAFSAASQSSKSIKELYEHELEVAKQNVTAAEEEIGQLQSKISNLEQELEKLRPKQAPDANVEHPDDADSSMNEAERAEQSSTKQLELQQEVDSLRVRLESARSQSDQMRQLAEDAEIRLNEVMEDSKQMEERLMAEMNNDKQRCDFLESQLDLEKKERQNLVNENIRTAEEAHKMNAELRRELSCVQSSLESAEIRCQSALELEAGAKSEIEAHEKIAQEARSKYERELALHAEDVETLTDARQQADAARSQLAEVQHHMTTAEARADTLANELDSMSVSWDTERQQLLDQVSQAGKDQDLMQEQILKLTQQIISLRKMMDKSEESANQSQLTDSSLTETDGPSAASDLKTSEDLLQLVNYLRRQKSIAEASCDASSAEVARLLLRISSMEHQRDHAQDELEKERKASELVAETSQRHSELMERVEQLNIVTESNRLLRHERETLQKNLTAMEKQVEELQAYVGPLRNTNSELQAQVASFGSESRSLEEERDRWKERCNRLVETAQRMDPEQYRMACNERDELQRQLRRSEEEVLQLTSRMNDLRTELDQESDRLCEELREAQISQQSAEQLYAEANAACSTLRKELEGKDTTVVKLRVIGRKYRQETETLRRQMSVNRTGEAQLQSVNEALTEARADLVTLRADLAEVRSRHSVLFAYWRETAQLVAHMKSMDNISSILSSVPTPLVGEESDLDEDQSHLQHVYNALRATFDNLAREVEKLQHEAESQKERLMRMQLIESQLNKSLRECVELRERLSHIQSAPVTAVTSVQTTESEPTDLSHAAHSIQRRPPFTSTAVVSTTDVMTTHIASDSGAIGSSSNTSSCLTNSPESSPIPAVLTSTALPVAPTSTNSSNCASLPAWIMRAAAAAIQPVQPTPAVTPPSSIGSSNMAGPRQTAEIRPIASNVATVMPTPAVYSVPTVPLMIPTDAMSPPTLPVCTPSAMVIGDSTVPTIIPMSGVFPITTETVGRAEPVATIPLLRIAHPRRLTDNIAGSSQMSTGAPSWSSSIPSSSTFLVTGKRRAEEYSSAASPSESPAIPVEEVLPSTPFSVNSPDPSRAMIDQGESTMTVPSCSQTSVLFSSHPDAKRARHVVSSQQQQRSVEPSAVVLERSAFGQPTATPPLAHATASRLVAGHQEFEEEAWTDTAPNSTTFEEHLSRVVSAQPVQPVQYLSPVITPATTIPTTMTSDLFSLPPASQEPNMLTESDEQYPTASTMAVDDEALEQQVPVDARIYYQTTTSVEDDETTTITLSSTTPIADNVLISVQRNVEEMPKTSHQSPTATAITIDAVDESQEQVFELQAHSPAQDNDDNATDDREEQEQEPIHVGDEQVTADVEEVVDDEELGTEEIADDGDEDEEEVVYSDQFRQEDASREGLVEQQEEDDTEAEGREEVYDLEEADHEDETEEEEEEEDRDYSEDDVSTSGESTRGQVEGEDDGEEEQAYTVQQRGTSGDVIELSSESGQSSPHQSHHDEEGDEYLGGESNDADAEEDDGSESEHILEEEEVVEESSQLAASEDVGQSELSGDEYQSCVSRTTEIREPSGDDEGKSNPADVESGAASSTETTPQRTMSLGGTSVFGSVPQSTFSGFRSATSGTGGLFSSFRSAAESASGAETKPFAMGSGSSPFGPTPSLFKSSVLTPVAGTWPPMKSTPLFSSGAATTVTSGDTSADKSSAGIVSGSVVDSQAGKPKIQPIIWDSAKKSAQPVSAEPPAPRLGAARRKKWGGTSQIRTGPYVGPPGAPSATSKPETFGPSRSNVPGPSSLRPGQRRA